MNEGRIKITHDECFTFTFAVQQQKVREQNITEPNRNTQVKTAKETNIARDDQLIMNWAIFPYLAF
jgi:hypothetical protein